MQLRKIFWDYTFSEEELQDLLAGKRERVGHLDREGLYARLLTSWKWYDILDLVGIEHVDELLSDAVLRRIHSKALREKYVAVKRLLSQ
ncbi:MAG: hypothetical protein V1799_19580 [bacterium]